MPTTVQQLRFVAEQVTREKVGVEVTGVAVYRIAEPLIAFRMVNFSYPERAQEKLEELLGEMFVGAVRRLVANLSVEECLCRRKEGIAAELMREIVPVVSGQRPARRRHATAAGASSSTTIEIQDVRVLSQAVFANMQAKYRKEQERARARGRARDPARAGAGAGEGRSRDRPRAAGLRDRGGGAAPRGRGAEPARRARRQGQGGDRGARRPGGRGPAGDRAAGRADGRRRRPPRAPRDRAHARRARRPPPPARAGARARPGPRPARDRERRLPGAIQLSVARELPRIAMAFQQKLGEIHITAVNGANPFGVVAAAVESVLGLARSAGLELPKPKPCPPGKSRARQRSRRIPERALQSPAMAKSKPAGTLPKEIEPAYQLWTRGNVRGARQEAKRVLATKPADPEVAALAQRVLDDTRVDARTLQVGVGGVVFVAVILFLLFR